MVKIAGREVKFGDRLFYIPKGVWVTVIRVDRATVVAEYVQSGNSQSKYFIENGGSIFNRSSDGQVFFWHEPLKLNLPIGDVAWVQEMLDSNLEFVKRYGGRLRV